MLTQWNQQLSRYVFSKVIELLEQNIRKQINCKLSSSTKQINRVQVRLVLLLAWELYLASSMQLVNKITLATFSFNKHLTMKTFIALTYLLGYGEWITLVSNYCFSFAWTLLLEGVPSFTNHHYLSFLLLVQK